MRIGLGLGLTGQIGAFGAAWDFTGGTLPPGVSFSRASTATRIGPTGAVEVLAADQPRFDHDPVTLPMIAGVPLPVRVTRVRATGTTATGIVGVW